LVYTYRTSQSSMDILPGTVVKRGNGLCRCPYGWEKVIVIIFQRI